MSTAVYQPVLADRLVKEKSLLKDVMLVLAGAGLVGLLAQVAIPIQPVPITGQTLGVMLVGATLGAKRGAYALTSYMVLGVLGVPWFSGFHAGMATVLSPTFGYIIGFIPTAFVIGYLSQRSWDRRPFLALVAFLIASIIPYFFGIPWMVAVLSSTQEMNFMLAMQLGFIPFIPGGIVKWLIGAALLPAAWKGVEWLDKR